MSEATKKRSAAQRPAGAKDRRDPFDDPYIPIVISAPEFVFGDDTIPFSVEGTDHKDASDLVVAWTPSGSSSPITGTSPASPIRMNAHDTGVTFFLATRNVGGNVTVTASVGANSVQTSVTVLAHS